jgi:hypothetical protein
MKIENKYIELTKFEHEKYNLSVKNSAHKNIVQNYLDKSILEWNYYANMKNRIEKISKSFVFNNVKITGLKNLIHHKEINAITIKAFLITAMHLIHTLENNGFAIIDFDLDDFIIVEMGGEIGSKDYAILCFFKSFEKCLPVKNKFIEFVSPLKKNDFYAPEINEIVSIPAKLVFPKKSSYYSIGKIAVYMLTKNKKTKTMEEYKIDLEPLLNSKIYWMILRCLAYNQRNRYLLYI